MSSPAFGAVMDSPSSRPADSAVGMTTSAPPCRSTPMFCCSLTAAAMVAVGLSRRVVSVTSTFVSSRSAATMTWFAPEIAACRSTSSRRASPTTPTQPSAVAALMLPPLISTTTIDSEDIPCSLSADTAERPFMPYPTTTVCLFTCLLQRAYRNCCRLRSVSASIVVPTSTIRNKKRSGVMMKMLTTRALSVTGVMSP